MVHELGGDEIIFNHLVAFHPSLKDEGLAGCKAYANEWMDRTREVADALGVRLNMPPNFVDTRDRPEPAAAPASTEKPADRI